MDCFDNLIMAGGIDSFSNVMTGYFVLFFGSVGFLTRAFMESIDEASSGSVEALKATGASYFTIIFQGVIHSSISQLLSWVLFMVESNIRNATLVWILTGTGIGFLFNLYYKSMNPDVPIIIASRSVKPDGSRYTHAAGTRSLRVDFVADKFSDTYNSNIKFYDKMPTIPNKDCRHFRR